MVIGDVEYLGIGAPFFSWFGMRCTFRAGGVVCQSSNSIDLLWDRRTYDAAIEVVLTGCDVCICLTVF